MFLGLPDPYPETVVTSTDPALDPSIIKQKIVRKTLISTGLGHLYDFFPVFRIRIIKIRMFLGLPDPYPDPLDRGEDPTIRIRIRIHTKMSRIHNTVWKYAKPNG
jgi:hypothetical protein